VTSTGGSALLVCAGASLFGTIGTARALGPEDASASAITLVRLAMAITLLWLALAVSRRGGLVAALRSRAVWAAGVSQAAFQVCFLESITRVGVAIGTLVAIGATPLLTGLAQAVTTRRLSGTWALATGSGLIGLVLLVGTGGGSSSGGAGSGSETAAGLLLALCSAAAYATYITVGGRIGAQGLEPTVVLPVIFTVAAAVQLPALALSGWAWLATTSGLWMVVYLALLPTVLAYALFNRGLAGVDAATAGTLGLVEPVVATLLAVLVLDEQLTAVQAGGALLVCTGVLLAARAAAPAQPVGGP